MRTRARTAHHDRPSARSSVFSIVGCVISIPTAPRGAGAGGAGGVSSFIFMVDYPAVAPRRVRGTRFDSRPPGDAMV